MSEPKFLVVEDDESARELLCTMLTSLGCNVTAVGTAEEAIEHVDHLENASDLDAIFLDIMLPGMSGYEALDQLKDRMYTQSIPVIVLTSQLGKDQIMSGYQHGADYYITKPFTLEQITYGLDLVLGGRDDAPDGSESAS